MKQLQTIKHPKFGQLSVIVIDGKEMFKAKECASMLGYSNINDAVSRHCKGVVKHDLPTKSGKQTVNLIPEGDVWRLIIRSKLPQAVEIEKWIMDEVLPSIRKTGKYSMHTESEPKQLELYDYFDKTYKGEPVLTVADVAYIIGLSSSIISWYTRTKLTINFDFYNLSKGELVKFKQENPKISRFSSGLCIITKSGFESICKAYGIKIETPKVFIESKTENKYNRISDDEFLKNTGKVIPSNNMYSLMGYIQRDAAEIQYYSSLLLTTDKKSKHEEYKEKLMKVIRHIRSFTVDIDAIKI